MKTTGILAMLCALIATFIGCNRSEKGPQVDGAPGAPSTPSAATTPATLAGTAWRVDSIAGCDVLANAPAFIRFDTEGRASGTTGLNNFTGPAAISGETIKIGPLAATRRAGPEELMDQEHQFFTGIESAVTWKRDEAGVLHLRNAAGDTLLRLSRVPAGDPDKSGGTASEK